MQRMQYANCSPLEIHQIPLTMSVTPAETLRLVFLLDEASILS